ncbi:hypothetical protein E2562_011377 [Oryza meyeriana var. granulata]|uniref:Retroviral polymerase SH3-like domain-containing protein n=1 Tax=Oryza meyeriana var. granulata TaxID=110450 RepID=A0A6G1EA61_9ORYZ|nr:hypothetical protein E2562_011377 [Oryza meyeriana var. granulata]
MIFLGYKAGSKAYQVYDPSTKRVHVTRDAVFDEATSWDWATRGGDENADNTTDFTVDYTVAPIGVTAPGPDQGGTSTIGTLQSGLGHRAVGVAGSGLPALGPWLARREDAAPPRAARWPSGPGLAESPPAADSRTMSRRAEGGACRAIGWRRRHVRRRCVARWEPVGRGQRRRPGGASVGRKAAARRDAGKTAGGAFEQWQAVCQGYGGALRCRERRRRRVGRNPG